MHSFLCNEALSLCPEPFCPRWFIYGGIASFAADAPTHCRWVLASSEAPPTAESEGPYELVGSDHWQMLSMYYGPDAEETGGGRKRSRQQQLGERLGGLLEQGIAATLVVDKPAGGAGDGSPGAAGGEQPATAAAAANGVAEAPRGGRPQRGRAAALVAEAAAAAADSGSDVDLLIEPELTIGSAQNPYKLNRRPNVRAGENAGARGSCLLVWG